MGQAEETMTPGISGLPAGVSRELLLFAVIGMLVNDATTDRSTSVSEGDEPLVLRGIGRPDSTLREEAERILDRYDDDVFWHELIHRLGERDFERRATDEEIHEIEVTDRYPERVSWHYDHWEKEFAEYGIDRLVIDDKECIEEERV